MDNGMTFYYDDEGDFLEVTFGDISNCYFDNTGNGIFRIVDKDTQEIKGVVVHNFKAKSRKLEEIKINLPFKFKVI